MKYNPLLHHRRSIRLKGYNYAQAGAYFITICIQNLERLFGEIRKGELFLNEAGAMVEKWWLKLPEKFPDIELDEYIIMPNHFHGIVINLGKSGAADTDYVRANPRVRPNPAAPNIQSGSFSVKSDANSGGEILGEHVGSPLHRVVQWFKTMTTNEYIRGVKSLDWPPFDGKLWQRNYYEHIIRTERAYLHIADYIRSNPAKWQEDLFYES